MYILQNLHWFILLIGALVFFHELGHFLVAKACNVKVQKFSLGFGPALLSRTHGETEYRIGALPLGGYVKMLGELPGVEISPEDAPRAFSHKPVWQRAAIVLAGPLFNFALALAVYFFMLMGSVTLGDTRVGIVTVGDPAWKAGLRPGDRITAVAGKPVREWNELREIVGAKASQAISVEYERDGKFHYTTLEPQARAELNIFQENETRGKIGVSLQYVRPVAGVVDPESPAALAGVRSGDVIAKVDDKPVSAWHEVRYALRDAKIGEPVALTVARDGVEERITLTPTAFPEGLRLDVFSAADMGDAYTGLVSKESVVAEVEPRTPAEEIGLRQGDRLVELIIDPGSAGGATVAQPIGVWAIDLASFQGVDARHRFTLRYQRGRSILEGTFSLVAKEERDELENVRTTYIFGANNEAGLLEAYTFVHDNTPWQALTQASARVGEDMTLIGKGIARLVGGKIPLDTMGGPIMLFVMAEKSAKRGAQSFLRMLAVISVNLGLLNLLPIPVLDGGHLMFCAVELVRRRPPSIRFREVANLVGLAILLVLMALVFHNDVMRYVLN